MEPRTRPRASPAARRPLKLVPGRGTGPLALATWLGLAPPVHAQAAPLEPGREVRLVVRGVANIFEGTLTAVSPDTLAMTLGDGRTFTVAPARLELAQVRVARRNTLRGAIVGGGVGLALGVALVVTDEAAGISQPTAPDDEFGASFDTWKLVAPPIAGAALGAVVGRFIRTGRWVPGVVPGAGIEPGDFAFGWSIPAGW